MPLINFDIKNINPDLKTLLWLTIVAFILSMGLNVMGGLGIVPPVLGQAAIDDEKYIKRSELEMIMKAQMADTIEAIREEFATKEVIDLKMKNIDDKLDSIINRLP